MKKIAVFTVLIFTFSIIFSQDTIKEKKYQFNGYVSQMSQTIIDSLKGNWLNDQVLHNRLKFNYFGIKNFTFDLEVRNRLMYGETYKYTPNIANLIENDRGFVDLSFNIISGNSFILNTSVDRAYIQFETNKFKAVIGRQRINWGMTFVWNPNDWFNNYSFFDFDYSEKPGADAVLLQYFPNFNSTIDFAAKINSDTLITAALKYRFNVKNYDVQVLGGIIDNEDASIGFGWSGNLWQLTFRGEGSYLHPIDNFGDTSGVFLGSVGLDYMFTNGTTLIAEFLYNQSAQNLNATSLFQFQQAPLNVKGLSFSKYNALLQVSYPISPVINTSIAAMWMNYNNWIFLSPNISFLISQEVDFSFVAQFFTGKMYNPVTMQNEQKLLSILFFRLKYDF